MGIAFDAAVQLAISSVMLGFLRDRGAVVCVEQRCGRERGRNEDRAKRPGRTADGVAPSGTTGASLKKSRTSLAGLDSSKW